MVNFWVVGQFEQIGRHESHPQRNPKVNMIFSLIGYFGYIFSLSLCHFGYLSFMNVTQIERRFALMTLWVVRGVVSEWMDHKIEIRWRPRLAPKILLLGIKRTPLYRAEAGTDKQIKNNRQKWNEIANMGKVGKVFPFCPFFPSLPTALPNRMSRGGDIQLWWRKKLCFLITITSHT